jgi:DNA-binding NarL/FixJ family response regulator
MTASPTLLILSTDLMSSVRIADTAAALGYDPRVVDQAGRLDGAAATLAVIDVASTPVDPAAVVSRLRAANPSARVIAVYRHTDPQQARAARAAGCDVVLNRAQFFGDIAGALQRVLPPEPSAPS